MIFSLFDVLVLNSVLPWSKVLLVVLRSIYDKQCDTQSRATQWASDTMTLTLTAFKLQQTFNWLQLLTHSSWNTKLELIKSTINWYLSGDRFYFVIGRNLAYFPKSLWSGQTKLKGRVSCFLTLDLNNKNKWLGF